MVIALIGVDIFESEMTTTQLILPTRLIDN